MWIRKTCGIDLEKSTIQFVVEPGKKYYAKLTKVIYNAKGQIVGFEDLKQFIQLKESK